MSLASFTHCLLVSKAANALGLDQDHLSGSRRRRRITIVRREVVEPDELSLGPEARDAERCPVRGTHPAARNGKTPTQKRNADGKRRHSLSWSPPDNLSVAGHLMSNPQCGHSGRMTAL